MKKSDAILLVDDDQVSTFLVQRLVARLNDSLEVIVANNGEDALEMIQEMCLMDGKCPELIILDINMPMMDGIEFMKVLNESNLRKFFRVVVFTTSSNERDYRILRSYGIDEFYLKPVTETEMREILNKQKRLTHH